MCVKKSGCFVVYSRFVEVSVLYMLLYFGELSGVERGVWEGGMHPWQPQAGHEDVDETCQHQVPV